MRAIDELADADDPAWPRLHEMVTASSVPAKLLPVDRDEGRRCLLQMQVTARSMLGAFVLNTGGLLLDDGWLRVFGGGSAVAGGLPSLGQVNGFPTVFDAAWNPVVGLVVGHDVVGGVFALNGHDPSASGRPGAPGQMIYFAPAHARVGGAGGRPLRVGLLAALGQPGDVLCRAALARLARGGRRPGPLTGDCRLSVPVVQGGPFGSRCHESAAGADARSARGGSRFRRAAGAGRSRRPRRGVSLPRIRTGLHGFTSGRHVSLARPPGAVGAPGGATPLSLVQPGIRRHRVPYLPCPATGR